MKYDIALSLVEMCDYDVSLCHNNWVKEYFRVTGKKEGK